MTSHCFRWSDFELHYYQSGQGNEAFLCLHGFGGSGVDFQVFKPFLKEGQQLVAIDLFAHGRTPFPESRLFRDPLGVEEWTRLIDALLDHLGLARIHLVGYSMGARLVLSYLRERPVNVSSVLLLAPDGLAIHPVYWFFAKTAPGRRIGRRWMYRPAFVRRLVALSGKLGWTAPKVTRFAMSQLEDAGQRKRLYAAWTFFRKLHPPLRHWVHLPGENQIGICMVFGKFDKVIPASLSQKLQRYPGYRKRILHIPFGHQMLTPVVAKYLVEKGAWSPGFLPDPAG